MSKNIIHPNEGETLMFMGNLYTIKISAAATDNQYFLFEELVPPTAGPPLHRHPEAEVFYVVQGEFEFILNDIQTSVRVTQGDIINVPSQAVHTFKNIGSTVGKLLIFVIPGDEEEFFREAGIPVSDLSQVPDLNQPPDLRLVDMNKVKTLAAKYKIEVINPDK